MLRMNTHRTALTKTRRQLQQQQQQQTGGQANSATTTRAATQHQRLRAAATVTAYSTVVNTRTALRQRGGGAVWLGLGAPPRRADLSFGSRIRRALPSTHPHLPTHEAATSEPAISFSRRVMLLRLFALRTAQRRVGQTRPAGRQPPTAPQTILLFLARALPAPIPECWLPASLWLGDHPTARGMEHIRVNSTSSTTLSTYTHA
jgi:hypothetical protein